MAILHGVVAVILLCSIPTSYLRPSNFKEDSDVQNATIVSQPEKSTLSTSTMNEPPSTTEILPYKNSNQSSVLPSSNKTEQKDVSDVLKTLLKGYDRRIRPLFEVRPVTVYVNMFISSVEGFDELTMDFSMTIYFRQWWYDPRLAYRSLYHKDSITIGGDILKQIWLPDTHFEYEKGGKDRTLAHMFLLKILRNGTVMWSRSNSVTTTCAMDLRSFPMDTQRCNFSIESFGYGINDVIYKWRSDKSAVQVKQDIAISRFILWKISKFDKISHYDTGSFSGIVAEFTLTRRTMYYIMQIYLPCAMIVFLSWVSFWIDSHSTPARISLGITTVLSMTTLLFGVQSSLPKVPYVKSLDVYMFVSFTLVFASLIEYACVNYYITKKETALVKSSLVQHENGGRLTHRHGVEGKETQQLLRRMRCQSLNLNMSSLGRLSSSPLSPAEPRACWPAVNLSPMPLDRNGLHAEERLVPRVNLVDRYSRVLFPVVFLLFNVIYWPIYML